MAPVPKNAMLAIRIDPAPIVDVVVLGILKDLMRLLVTVLLGSGRIIRTAGGPVTAKI